MSKKIQSCNKKLVKEIAIILMVKLTCLMAIKAIWFDKPAIPNAETEQVAAHIAGPIWASKESSR